VDSPSADFLPMIRAYCGTYDMSIQAMRALWRRKLACAVEDRGGRFDEPADDELPHGRAGDIFAAVELILGREGQILEYCCHKCRHYVVVESGGQSGCAENASRVQKVLLNL
jgi:hypothetical protein